MNRVLEALNEGLARHQAGLLSEAREIYANVLEQDAENADAFHLLGRLALQVGDLPRATFHAREAIRLRPDIPAFHATLGEIMTAQEKPREGELCYREALRLDPEHAPARINLGNLLQARGRYEDASIEYWRAIQLQPGRAEAYGNLGNVLRAQGRHQEAFHCYREALRLEPDSPAVLVNLSAGFLEQGGFLEAEGCARQALRLRPELSEALSNLSLALLNQDRQGEAEDACRRALARSPGSAHLHANLGSVLLRLGKLEQAEGACRNALALRPDYAEGANNLGAVLQAAERLEEAAGAYQAALDLRPDFTDAWANLGAVRQLQNRNAEAVACFDEALSRDPGHVRAHLSRGLNLLLAGNLREGFAEYEWRAGMLGPPPSAKPRWNGGPLAGKTVLLYAEQGLGDTLQFVRFAAPAAARGGRVVVACQSAVAPLVASAAGVSEVADPDGPLPEHDLQAPLMSLAGILGADPASGLSATSYLSADPARVEHWRRRLGPRVALRVGLIWAGNRCHANDRRRSIPFAKLAPLAGITGVEWHNLQYGEARGEARSAAWLRREVPADCVLADLAAVMASMDLVISADTMPAHLAGALGRPVWTLLAFAPDWRWQLVGEDTPWYPSMRLFRQPKPGDWESVVERVSAALCGLFVQEDEKRSDMEG